MKTKAFSILELLILVAIASILFAVAAPNFLNARIRASVTCADTDLRNLSTALEAYFVDHGAYPPCNNFGLPFQGGIGDNYIVLERLSTPVAYIVSSIITDCSNAQFRTGSQYSGGEGDGSGQPGLAGIYPASNGSIIQYISGTNDSRANQSSFAGPIFTPVIYTIHAAGPDQIQFNTGGVFANNGKSSDSRTAATKTAYAVNIIYDATNGTVSFGSVWRAGGELRNDYAHYMLNAINGTQGRIIFNEVLADPDPTLGDANNDGVVDASEDEFIEFINTGSTSVDISGWTIKDGSGTVRHTFPPLSNAPARAAIVIFGGGTPTGIFSNGIIRAAANNTLVQTASSGSLNLRNTAETITLSDQTGLEIASLTYGPEGNNNQSLTRDPDWTGGFFAHASAPNSAGALFSPGTLIDGSAIPATNGTQTSAKHWQEY